VTDFEKIIDFGLIVRLDVEFYVLVKLCTIQL
jgi:hypothetical protein